MKKNIIIPALGCLALLTSSCGKDFLSPEPSQYMTRSQRDEKTKDPELLSKFSAASLQATYNVFGNSHAPTITRGHDNFGLAAHHWALELMGEDALMNQRNWFVFDYELGNFKAGYRRTLATWRIFYKVIADANIILEDYYAEEKDDVAYKELKSIPLAMRGISYFYLVNFYQLSYKGHEDALGVPLALSSKDAKLPRATVRNVYAQIIRDLEYAANNGPKTPEQTDIDRYVAAAYLAKAYAHMEDWENVAKYAAVAKQGAKDIVSEPGRSWELGTADILWGFDITPVNTGLYASLYSQIDPTQIGYARGGALKFIHNLLYNQIPETDSRRKLFANKKDNLEIFEAYQAKAPVIEDYAQLKFIGTPAGNTGDYCFLRVQDPILLEIEALNELDRTADAAKLLNEFVQLRNPQFVAPSTKDELRNEIRLQRRIELWGEGSALFDRKRWKLDVVRNIPESNHMTKVNYKMDDIKYIHELPQAELDSNSELVQN